MYLRRAERLLVRRREEQSTGVRLLSREGVVGTGL
jgi:hypothetical protein